MHKYIAPAWAHSIYDISGKLTEDLGPGPRQLKMAWVINLHKFLTPFVVIFWILRFRNHSHAAYVYLALHGSYGVIWVLKHLAFRDRKWETRITWGGAITTFLLISRDPDGPGAPPSPAFLAACIGLFALGLALMIAADCQKNTALKYRKELITWGMFRHIRHPNYLGEMMIYAAFALLARHWLPWVVLAYWWIMVFLVNMLVIESSLSRYPEWQAYHSRTGMLLPWRWRGKRRTSL